MDDGNDKELDGYEQDNDFNSRDTIQASFEPHSKFKTIEHLDDDDDDGPEEKKNSNTESPNRVKESDDKHEDVEDKKD